MSGDSLREAVLAVLHSPVGPSNRHTQTADALVPVIEAFIAAREAAVVERCAQVADGVAADCQREAGKHTEGGETWGRWDLARVISRDIAAAIRSRGEGEVK